MKKITNLFVAGFLCCAFSFTSCSKKKSDPPAPAVPSTMSAQINGQAWTATNTIATLIIVSGTGRRIDITGQDGKYAMTLSSEDSLVSTTLLSNVTYNELDANLDGEDDLTPESNALFTYGEKNNLGGYTYPFTYARGSFTITSVDNTNKRISGTFTYRTDNYDYSNPTNNADVVIVNVTQGTFNMPYTIYHQ